MTGNDHGIRRRSRPGAGWLTVIVAAGAALVPAAATGSARAAAYPDGPGTRGDLAAGVISTVAGGVGGPARATQVALINGCGVSSANGSVYVGDAGAVRKVSRTGRLTTPAGTGVTGPLGDGGAATGASVSACGVANDSFGNLVIADGGHQRVRVVAEGTGTFYGRAMTARHIYTVAGNGTQGFAGDGGPATGAELNFPDAVAVDGAGNLVIADSDNNRIRVLVESTGTFYGKQMTAGNTYTVAGGRTPGFFGDGGPAARAELNQPGGVAMDGAGNLVIADTHNDRIREVGG